MSIHDFAAQRLFLDRELAAGRAVTATAEQANYLRNVLRLDDGDTILVFNGRDGEWRARLAVSGKRSIALVPEACVRAQTDGPDVHYYFAPLKRARLDYMVQKAVELGVARLGPVLTRHTIAERVNLERMRANAIEAAEQCGVLRLPQIAEPIKLPRLIADWDAGRSLIVCDEAAPVADPVAALAALRRSAPVAVLIGPEGGFADEERRLLLGQPFTKAISLGPRVMRADTAAVAALALVNAVLADWA